MSGRALPGGVAVDIILDVWASAYHFRQAGGKGWPSRDECLQQVSEPEALGLSFRLAESSSSTYDASPDKFVRAARGVPPVSTDFRTLSDLVIVETAFERYRPTWLLVDYILLRHPVAGRFQPRETLSNIQTEKEAALAYIDRSQAQMAVVGERVGKWGRECLATVIVSGYNEARKVVRDVKNGFDPAKF
jgi:hypothetical protein